MKYLTFWGNLLKVIVAHRYDKCISLHGAILYLAMISHAGLILLYSFNFLFLVILFWFDHPSVSKLNAHCHLRI